MYVGQVMTRNVITTSPDEALDAVFRNMMKKRITHLPVLKKGALVGVISDRDLNKAFLSKRTSRSKNPSFDDMTAADIMTAEVVTAESGMHVADAVNLMKRLNIGSLLVVEKNKLKGIVTKDDILGVFVEMLRVIQSSSTIDIELVDEVDDVESVLSVLKKHDAIVLNYSAAPRGKNSRQMCHFRLKLCPVQPIVRDLKKKGVKVLEAYGDD